MEIKAKKIHTWNYLNRKLTFSNHIDAFFLTRNDFFRCDEGRFVKIKYNSNDLIVFFNHTISSCSFNDVLRTQETHKLGEEMRIKYNYNNIFVVRKNDEFFGNIIVSCYEKPEGLDDMYKSCISSNPKILNPIFTKYNIDSEYSTLCRLIYLLSKGSANFLAWGLKNIYNRNLNLYQLIHVFTWNNKYNTIANKLSKGTITAYNNQGDINNLFREMSILRHGKRVNDSINTFNTAQKRMLKSVTLNEDEKNALAKMKRLSPVVQSNFVRKMSTIEDVNEIFSQLHHLVNTHFKWNKESYLDYVKNGENLKCNVVYDNNNIVIVEVKDYETIKRIAKNSNWCISKNRQYWENYINDHNRDKTKQYVMCDFSKREDDVLSMIGFTVTKDRITAAHNFINDNMLRETPSYVQNRKSFIFLSDGIYKIFEENNISLRELIGLSKSKESSKVVKLNADWNKESILNLFFNSVKKGNCIILKNIDNKLIVIGLNMNINSIIKQINRQSLLASFINYVFKFDFSKELKNDKSFEVYPLRNFTSNELDIYSGYNQYLKETKRNIFNLFREENIPYDILPSCSNKKELIKTLIENNLIEEFDELLNEEENRRVLNSISEDLTRSLITSICEYGCYDLLKCLYKHNIYLTKILEKKDMLFFMDEMYHRIMHNKTYTMANPDDEIFNQIWDYKIPNNLDRRILIVYGFITVLIQLMKHEGERQDIYSSIVNYTRKTCPLVTKFCLMSAKTISLNKVTNELKNLLNFSAMNNLNEVFDILYERKVVNKVVLKKILEVLQSNGGRYNYSSQIDRFQNIFEKKYGVEEQIKNLDEKNNKTFHRIETEDFLDTLLGMTINAYHERN